MKGKNSAGEEMSPPANDNHPGKSDAAAIPLDPRIRRIAQAIGRYMAREQVKAWHARQCRAANDNRRHPHDP